VLYNLVYNIRNNKHIIFAIWLSKLPANGTAVKLSTLNKKFGVNYKTANDLCFKFLKPARLSLDQYNTLSFTYRYKGDSIFIFPYYTKIKTDIDLSSKNAGSHEITRRLRYFRKRYGLQENEMVQLTYQYKNIAQTRELIEKAFREFIRSNRSKGIKSISFQGKAFLIEIQETIIKLYRNTRTGTLLPNGYPVII